MGATAAAQPARWWCSSFWHCLSPACTSCCTAPQTQLLASISVSYVSDELHGHEPAVLDSSTVLVVVVSCNAARSGRMHACVPVCMTAESEQQCSQSLATMCS